MTDPVALSGEIDVSNVPELRERLYSAIDGAPGAAVTVDLSAVTFIDSTGLGVLVGALRRARANDGEVKLAGATGPVLKVFTITGLDKVFSMADA